MRFLILIVAMLIPFIAYAEEASESVAIEDIRVIKISSEDEMAVIKTTGRELLVIKVGDSIGESIKVIEITEGMVVFEETTDIGIETVIMRLENGKQRVERTRKAGDEEAQPYGNE